MPMVAISPHPRYGGEPFDKEVEFEPNIEREIVSEDLVWLFGSMEMVSPSLVASVNGQNVKCTGLVDFSMGYEDRSCSVAAWVTLDLQDRLMSMNDVEEHHAVEVARDNPNHDVGNAVEVTIKDPKRYAGLDATEYIPAGLLPPFHLGWWREVVYVSAKLRPQIYYHDPERKKFRSRKAIAQHFQDKPQNHLSEWSFDWRREPLGLNNQHYEVACEAKQQKARLPGVFHSRPGDIGEESWGILEPAEDYNANSTDFHKEQATYAKAKKVKEGQHTIGHTIWQTRGATSSWSTSDDEPVAVTVKEVRHF
jgi:hypothetical protein